LSDFDGIDQVVVTEKLANIQPGAYVFEVQAVKKIQSRKKGKMFVGEFKVLESNGPRANGVGTTCSHVIPLNMETSLKHIKGMAAALTNTSASDIDAKACDDLVDESNPARGVKVRAEAQEIITKAGNPFTLISYKPFSS
jgi:hypothetical protein